MRELQRVHSLPPVIGPRPRVLVLGSMPGTESLRLRRYYGHPRNDFWPILCTILKEDPEADYEDRIRMLERHHVALWDVAASCERLCSADASMRSVVANDIPGLLRAEPTLQVIALNGLKAAALFRRCFSPTGISARGIRGSPGITAEMTIVPLPSTSPAHAAMSRAEKLRRWTLAFARG